MNQNQRSIPPWLHCFIIASLLFGVYFRFAHLDQKNYWFDEVLNTLYSSGFTKGEWHQQVQAWNGRELSLQDLQRYQSIREGSHFTDVIAALAEEEPQNPPAYYLLSRWWTQWFGNSIAVRRSLSAFLSVLTLPCIYWLCWELFQSSLTGYFAAALVAVSPLHLVYAQEARMYAAWTLTTLLVSATFLRAIRLNTTANWIAYSLSLILGFYTFSFSVLVAAGHTIYILIQERFRFTKTLMAYFIASLVATLIFAPWIVAILTNSHKMGKWRQVSLTFLNLGMQWFLNLVRGFIFVPFLTNRLIVIAVGLIGLIFLSLSVYAFYVLFRQTSPKIWLFLVTLAVPIPLILILPDLILGGQRSLIARYLIPSYLALQIAIAYLFATQISKERLFPRKLWQVAFATLLTMGWISGVATFSNSCDFNKKFSCDDIQVVKWINQSPQSLIVSKTSLLTSVHLLSLSYRLNPQIRFMFAIPPSLLIPNQFNEVFVYSLSKSIGEGLQDEGEYQLEPNSKLERIYTTSIVQLHKITKTQ